MAQTMQAQKTDAKNTVKDTAQILSDYQDIIHQMEENYDPVYDD